jgi:hypothetical protein
MEYGFWLSEKENMHTLKECRHHGVQIFYLYQSRTQPQWRCSICHSQRQKGILHGKEPGCSNYVGLHIAEKVLSKAFKVMQKAGSKEAFDFYCGHDLKIDSKCSTKCKNKSSTEGFWFFHIRKNKVPKAFCLIALDNTPENVAEDPKPTHVWLIPGDAIINGKPLNERMSLTVSPRTIARLDSWRRTDMEGRIIKCCIKVKGEGNGKS